MEKTALIERLVRLGATDVPNTPRLLMKHRSPGELAQLQQGVTNAFGKIEAPLKQGLGHITSKLPGKLQGPVRWAGNKAIENPEFALPGGGAMVAGKKLLERGIDKLAPVPKLAFTVSQYSGALNPAIHSGASVLPPFKAPRLDTAIQKAAFATSQYDAGPAPTWAHAAASPSGASYLPSRKVPRLDAAADKVAEEQAKKRPGLPAAGLATVAGGAAASGAGGYIANHLIKNERRITAPFLDVIGDTSFPEISREGTLSHPGSGTPVMPAFDGNARYNLRNKKVYFPVGSTHAGGLAHELGHADIAKSRLGRAVQNPATATMGSFAAPIGALSGGLSGMSDNKTVQRLGVAAPLLAAAPQLAYEAAATIKGLSRLRRGGASGGDLLHAMKALGPGFGSYAGNAAMGVGSALMTQRAVQQARFDQEAAKNKTAAGAPTRGNFMMASDIPPFKAPRLDKAIQKDGAYEAEPYTSIFKGAKLVKLEGDAIIEVDKRGKSLGKGNLLKEKGGDALPEGIAMQPWDSFRRSKYASMSTEKLAEFVAELRKEAIPGLTPQSRLEHSTRIGAPRATPPPGPSIAAIAKPAGPGWGSGIAGAGKGSVSGGSVGGIGPMKSPPQL